MKPGKSLMIWVSVFAGLAYLPLMGQLGYFNDDWYLMWAAKAGGPDTFFPIFSIDRPLRAWLMYPVYSLFGENPLWYNLSAYILRVLGGLALGWMMKMLWPRMSLVALSIAVLYVIYPGFLSQPNAIDYQSHIMALFLANLSLALTIKTLLSSASKPKQVLFFSLSALTGGLYLGLMEYYIGFELIRLLLILLLALRNHTDWKQQIKQTLRYGVPHLVIPLGFIFWRVFIFTGERQATNAGAQLISFLTSPLQTALNWFFTLSGDVLDALIFAWIIPLSQLINDVTWVGIISALLAAALSWFMITEKQETDAPWNREAVWLGIGSILAGLFPVIMVNREVSFPDYSRYTLVASGGVVIILIWFAFTLPKVFWQKMAIASLIFVSILTHSANSTRAAHETEAIKNFWWQVAWRAPQLETNTTLVALYPVGNIQEDYFVWGPANLIYYPHSQNAEYLQPGIYAALAGEDTLQKAKARERQVYDLRRSIRTYANYRNLLILSQPDEASCMQALDSNLPEIAATAPDFVRDIAPYSEIEHIQTNAPALTPPYYPFGAEPAHTWCYYYQKISLARQKGDWQEAHRLSAESLELGYAPKIEMEWLPLLHSLAQTRDWTRLEQVSVKIGRNLPPTECLRLANLPLPLADLQSLQNTFCAAPP